MIVDEEGEDEEEEEEDDGGQERVAEVLRDSQFLLRHGVMPASLARPDTLKLHFILLREPGKVRKCHNPDTFSEVILWHFSFPSLRNSNVFISNI